MIKLGDQIVWVDMTNAGLVVTGTVTKLTPTHCWMDDCHEEEEKLNLKHCFPLADLAEIMKILAKE
jgi:hypothetical protein